MSATRAPRCDGPRARGRLSRRGRPRGARCGRLSQWPAGGCWGATSPQWHRCGALRSRAAETTPVLMHRLSPDTALAHTATSGLRSGALRVCAHRSATPPTRTRIHAHARAHAERVGPPTYHTECELQCDRLTAGPEELLTTGMPPAASGSEAQAMRGSTSCWPLPVPLTVHQRERGCDRVHLQAGGAAGRALWPTRARCGRRPRSQSSAPPAPPPRPRLGSCAPWGGTGINNLSYAWEQHLFRLTPGHRSRGQSSTV